MTDDYTPDLSRPLAAYWVGDFDVFAAVDADQALTLANDLLGRPPVFTPADVSPVQATTLDETRPDSPSGNGYNLRTLLAAKKCPGYLAGYER